MGLVAGVFYREFTKFYDFQAKTHLSILHVHTLVLGFVSLLIIYIVSKGYDRHRIQTLKKPIQAYITGFTFTLVNMTVFGIYEVVSQEQATFSEAALEGTSGIGHIILGVGLVWTMVRLFKNEEMISLIKQKAKG